MHQQFFKGDKHWLTRHRKRALTLAALTIIVCCLFFLTGSFTTKGSDQDRQESMGSLSRSRGYNRAFCASQLLPKVPLVRATVASIYELAAAFSDAGTAHGELVRGVRAVFDIDITVGRLTVPAPFRPRALAMFPALDGTDEAQQLRRLESQPVVTVQNRHTHDMTYFNNIRRFRPGAEAPLTREDEEKIRVLFSAGATPEECDFCSVERTAVDTFGRKEGPAAYTAANIAKVSAWHTLIVARRHNPLDLDVPGLVDMLNQSAAWFEEVARTDPSQQFGNLICDVGKRASASQVHMHFQAWTTRAQFSAGFARMHAAAQLYEERHDASYWAALIEAHAAAGLVLRVGSAYVFPHLCPAKEKEVLVIDPRPTQDFFRAAALVMVALREQAGTRSLSMGAALPYPQRRGDADMPALLRIVDRGNPLDARGDTGGFEYFTSPYVGSDPYTVLAALRRGLALP